VSKKWITMQTPLKDRVVDSVALQAALDLLAQPGYKLVQAVPQT
jgi:hypothetical protein